MPKFSILILASYIALFSACTEGETNEITAQNNSEVLSIENSLKWEVSPDELESEIAAAISMEEFVSKEELARSELTISILSNGKYLFSIDQFEVAKIKLPELNCSGSGLIFVKCVMEAMENKGCVVIRSDGEKNYLGYSDCESN